MQQILLPNTITYVNQKPNDINLKLIAMMMILTYFRPMFHFYTP